MDGETNSGAGREQLIGLVGALLDDNALHDLLQRLSVLACHAVGSAQAVSITITENGRYRTANSTGPDALAIDEAQYEQNGGPCLEAIRSGQQLEVVVGERPDRWPLFDKEAAGVGVSRVLSTPLSRDSDVTLGALNVYAGPDGRFEPGDRQTAELIGESASLLVARARALLSSNRLNEQLREAVETREIIGAAKGILMQAQGCSRDEAFDVLRRASQRKNQKLRDVAADVVQRVEGRMKGVGSPS